MLLLLLPATVLLVVGAPLAVQLLAPGFAADQVALTVRLARIVLTATVVVAATNLLTAMLHAHRRHVWPSLEGLPSLLGVEALALGFVVGSFARLLLQLVGLRGTACGAAADGLDPSRCSDLARSAAHGAGQPRLVQRQRRGRPTRGVDADDGSDRGAGVRPPAGDASARPAVACAAPGAVPVVERPARD